jgi:glycosyltransferase involved in cell wall biosynthesis
MKNKVYVLKNINPVSQALRNIGFDGDDNTSELDIDRQIDKALAYNYTELFISYPVSYKVWTKVEKLKLKKTLIIDDNISESELEKIGHNFDQIVFLSSGHNIDKLKNIIKSNKSIRFLFQITKKNRLTKNLMNFIERSNVEAFFYFPLKKKLNDKYLSTRQIKNIIEKSSINIHAYPGLNVYESRAPNDMEFCPLLRPMLEVNEELIPKISESIIIPVFNQRNEVLKTLSTLFKQKNINEFQIVLVDDGSNDGLMYEIKKLEFNIPKNIYFNFIRNPRVHERKMGDARFRAGIARNIGVRSAIGKNIHFLDADVLVPENYLNQVVLDLQKNDLVQIQRYDLNKKSSLRIESCADVDFENDIIFKGQEYWHDFFSKGTDWNTLEHSWKYVCSYGISLSRELLNSVGGIRNNYIFYGFEDTDLGFNLYKNNKKFFLSNIKSYHQFHTDERSEFNNSKSARNRVLSKSGQMFFHNNLDVSIYKEMIDFTFPMYSFWQWVVFLLTPYKYFKK